MSNETTIKTAEELLVKMYLAEHEYTSRLISEKLELKEQNNDLQKVVDAISRITSTSVYNDRNYLDFSTVSERNEDYELLKKYLVKEEE